MPREFHCHPATSAAEVSAAQRCARVPDGRRVAQAVVQAHDVADLEPLQCADVEFTAFEFQLQGHR
ncbi:MAG: hypothetical protein JWQ76_4345, partial [Ramlibacter sp.]|nr:hypothetical protein [Ramlibacter sp.]